jgi:hypothetical protein
VKLQFHIQPCPNGPWYTITLSPIKFKYRDGKKTKPKCASMHHGAQAMRDEPHSMHYGAHCADHCGYQGEQYCCDHVQECVCKGRSEILRRCYGEMGKDAKIRRTGRARFGFGIDTF